MGRFFDAVKAGVKGFRDANGPRGFMVAGRQVKCPHCGEAEFVPGNAMLNRRGTTLVNLDWTDPGASILICAECGRIEWFAHDPDEMPAS